MGDDTDIGGNNSLPKAERDFADLQNEISGNDVGRTARFLTGESSASGIEKKRAEQERVSTLLDLLMNDPVYRELHTQAMGALVRAENATDIALARAEEAFGLAQSELADTLAGANTLADGTRVFRDAQGHVFTEDGRAVGPEELDGIEWREAAPSYEEFREQMQAVDRYRESIDRIRRYQVEVLGAARDRLSDKENPPSKEEIAEIIDEIEQQKPPEVRIIMEAEEAGPASPAHDMSGLTLAPIGG